MLTREEHKELISKIEQTLLAINDMLRCPSSERKVRGEWGKVCAEELEAYINKIGPSKYEHPLFKKQQNDGLREKQGR